MCYLPRIRLCSSLGLSSSRRRRERCTLSFHDHGAFGKWPVRHLSRVWTPQSSVPSVPATTVIDTPAKPFVTTEKTTISLPTATAVTLTHRIHQSRSGAESASHLAWRNSSQRKLYFGIIPGIAHRILKDYPGGQHAQNSWTTPR